METRVKKIQITFELTTEKEWREFIRRPGLVVIDLYREWAGPCTAMSTALKNLKTSELAYEWMHLATAPSGIVPELQRLQGSRPTFVLLSGGRLVTVIYGCNAPEVLRIIKKEIDREVRASQGKGKRRTVSLTKLCPAEVAHNEKVLAVEGGAARDAFAQAQLEADRKLRKILTQVSEKLPSTTLVVIFPYALQDCDVILASLRTSWAELGVTVSQEELVELNREAVDLMFWERRLPQHDVLLDSVTQGASLVMMLQAQEEGEEEAEEDEVTDHRINIEHTIARSIYGFLPGTGSSMEMITDAGGTPAEEDDMSLEENQTDREKDLEGDQQEPEEKHESEAELKEPEVDRQETEAEQEKLEEEHKEPAAEQKELEEEHQEPAVEQKEPEEEHQEEEGGEQQESAGKKQQPDEGGHDADGGKSESEVGQLEPEEEQPDHEEAKRSLEGEAATERGEEGNGGGHEEEQSSVQDVFPEQSGSPMTDSGSSRLSAFLEEDVQPVRVWNPRELLPALDSAAARLLFRGDEEGPVLPGIWTPLTPITKAAAVKALFPEMAENLYDPPTPPPPPKPESTVICFSGDKRDEVLQLSAGFESEVTRYGFFTKNRKLLAGARPDYEKLVRSGLQTAKTLVVLEVTRVRSAPLLELSTAGPLYISATPAIAKSDIEEFFGSRCKRADQEELSGIMKQVEVAEEELPPPPPEAAAEPTPEGPPDASPEQGGPDGQLEGQVEDQPEGHQDLGGGEPPLEPPRLGEAGAGATRSSDLGLAGISALPSSLVGSVAEADAGEQTVAADPGEDMGSGRGDAPPTEELSAAGRASVQQPAEE